VQRQVRGRGGCWLLPQTSERKRYTVEKQQKEGQERKSHEDMAGREESEKTIQDVEALENKIFQLRSQLDRAAQRIVAKDKDLEILGKKR